MDKTTTIEQTVQRLNSAYSKRQSIKVEVTTTTKELEKLEQEQENIERSISELENTLKNLVNE